MNQFNSKQSIGEIVSIMPKASDVFKEYQIDFCCGGHRPLIEAINKQKLNEQEILNKLDEAYEEMQKYKNVTDFRNMSSADLIDYIVNTHHSYLGRALPEISELTLTIMKVHGASHKELFDVHRLFHNLKSELEQHLIKEESILFPLMKEYENNPTTALLNKTAEVLRETEQEHDAAGDILKELRRITNNFTVPSDGCGTYQKTFDKIRELESDLFQHIHLENNILFRRLENNIFE